MPNDETLANIDLGLLDIQQSGIAPTREQMNR